MKGNLLIVDDELLLLKWLRSSLAEYADQVFVAENGVQAMEVIAKEKIHCIVCDVNMPLMNGVDVIKKLRAQENNVPFIFYTGHGNHELMLEAAKYGAFDFLNKPSFNGIEEAVELGLQTGINANVLSKKDLTSEYTKLLEELEKLK